MGYVKVTFPDDSPVEGTGLFSEEFQHFISGDYFVSLDRLVPAWIKLAKEQGEGVWINFARHGVEDYHLAFFRHSTESYDHADCLNSSPQEVACIATAKAIKGLNEYNRSE